MSDAAMKDVSAEAVPCLKRLLSLWVVVAMFLVVGCGQKSTVEVDNVQPPPPAEAIPEAAQPPVDPVTQLQRDLKARNPFFRPETLLAEAEDGVVVRAELANAELSDISPLANTRLKALGIRNSLVQDISPLSKLPLEALYLEETQVKDLAPLKGMPLKVLWVTYSPVSDITPLADLKLRELNLVGTRVTDLAPLAKVPLEMLWLSETPVVDIEPLQNAPLVSLTLHKTPVQNLGPLANVKTLQRLHIGESSVSDLTPLAGLTLDRLIFTPGKIEQGLNVVREMKSLKELDTQFGEGKVRTPAQFWSSIEAAGN